MPQRFLKDTIMPTIFRSTCAAVVLSSAILTPTAIAELVELPRPAASYQGVATVHVPGSQQMAVTLNVRGEMLRVQVPGSATGSPHTTVFILDRPAGSVVSFPSGTAVTPVEQFALRLDIAQADELGLAMPSAFPRGTVEGSDQHLGESCTVYSARDPGQPDTAYQACMTDDGILLHLREQARHEPLFTMTALQRGNQDDAHFRVPAGYQVLDLSAAGGVMDLLKDFMGTK